MLPPRPHFSVSSEPLIGGGNKKLGSWEVTLARSSTPQGRKGSGKKAISLGVCGVWGKYKVQDRVRVVCCITPGGAILTCHYRFVL